MIPNSEVVVAMRSSWLEELADDGTAASLDQASPKRPG
jgi:hypothetical protein